MMSEASILFCFITAVGGLEADIVEWFRSDDQMRTLDDIVAHFPGKSKTEVKKALDSLCDQGILYGGDNIVGCMYGLV